MKILVFIKQVPNTHEVRVDPKTGTLIREGVPSIINPEDKNALELALQLKEQIKAHTIVATMGPSQAEWSLRESLAMGIDEAYLISDTAFAGSDTLATSLVLAAFAKKIGFDLILTGRQAIDGDTAQVGPEIAEHLQIPHVTYVEKAEFSGDFVKVQRALEDGYEIVKTKLPCLLACSKDLNIPRYMNMNDLFGCFKKTIQTLKLSDLFLKREDVGLTGSPTKVRKTFTKGPKKKGRKIELNPYESAEQIFIELQNRQLV